MSMLFDTIDAMYQYVMLQVSNVMYVYVCYVLTLTPEEQIESIRLRIVILFREI